ncbi:Exonuclease VII small subunit [Saprospira grandis DSM 2844]|uniref:Exonuclease VII small subunit n=1 Tax=Saprospira grandis DSM 2844 TaxID=694433 RepID=J0P953_9BACT|nr:exodeoxyribonuclease VII small subunit [Saprospira grandis]EJF54102.1 Exonuclease VII small subunit [Saprospira grandis DSM 2844]
MDQQATPPSYEAALLELQQILEAIEGQLPLEELNAKSRRAQFLLQYCQQRLRHIEEEQNNIYEED